LDGALMCDVNSRSTNTEDGALIVVCSGKSQYVCGASRTRNRNKTMYRQHFWR
jgi:hypothetical protein